MKSYAWAFLVIAGVFETGFSIGLKILGRIYSAVAVGSDCDHDSAEPGPGRGCDAESAAGYGVRSMDRNSRGGYSRAGHLAVWESAALSRLACLGLIVTGILGLKFIGN